MEQAKASATSNVAESDSAMSISALLKELEDGSESSENAISNAVSAAETEISGEATIAYSDTRIKATCDEILLAFISLRDSDTHGQQLIRDFEEQFGTVLNHGSVYPPLYGLCEDGRLEQRELVHSKEYVFADSDAARSDIVAAVRQHFAFGRLLETALLLGSFGGANPSEQKNSSSQGKHS